MDSRDLIEMGSWQCKARLVSDPVKGKCVFAAQEIPAGAVIGHCGGPEVDRDTVHSIHLGGKRIDPSEPFRFISHSCDPNAQFRAKGRWLYAARDIPAGTEITIDYLHTEPVISAPFECRCGSARCRGMICTPEPTTVPAPARRPATRRTATRR